jgi:hypothetical protein
MGGIFSNGSIAWRRNKLIVTYLVLLYLGQHLVSQDMGGILTYGPAVNSVAGAISSTAVSASLMLLEVLAASSSSGTMVLAKLLPDQDIFCEYVSMDNDVSIDG